MAAQDVLALIVAEYSFWMACLLYLFNKDIDNYDDDSESITIYNSYSPEYCSLENAKGGGTKRW